jgi:hypothetical protein
MFLTCAGWVHRRWEKADASICLSGGTGTGNLPTDPGWDRIQTATELYADAYAPVIVFSGGGSTRSMSGAEAYADAAARVPREATVIDARILDRRQSIPLA